MAEDFRSGFIAVVGRPNTGKSTLINRLIGAKVSITSPRPQTTRSPIRGIRNGPGYQAIFVDTPGSQKPQDTLRHRMQQRVTESLAESDVILFLIDATQSTGPGDRYVSQLISKTRTQVLVGVNKVDLLPEPSAVLPVLDQVSSLLQAKEIFPLSAATGLNVELLMQSVVGLLPAAPKYFPEGMVTDYPEAFILAEYIREKALLVLREEVPHAVAVEIVEVKEKSNIRVIYAIIHVERASQKAIVLGSLGSNIKAIGTEARRDAERLLGIKIYLDLKVKVSQGWRNDPKFLERLGL